jgi:quercetin dioxygenase-like cupin family protein
MEIKRSGSQPSSYASAEYFKGLVRIDSLFEPPAPARVYSLLVTFEPGAHTCWHSHPLGQTLIVTAGAGWVQKDGEARQNIFPGDVIYISPNEKHWHGATASTAMSHIAVNEKLHDSPVDWMEMVTDEQYIGG